MKRRNYLQMLVAGAAAGSLALSADRAHPIRLDVDLAVDPANEKELLHNFETIFKPAAVKHPG